MVGMGNDKTIICIQARIEFRGGLIVYSVMQAYGSLALEYDSEVDEAEMDKCSISCVSTSTF